MKNVPTENWLFFKKGFEPHDEHEIDQVMLVIYEL